jgi:hypothetical protein
MASYAEGGAERIIATLLARVDSGYSAQVRTALLGHDLELEQLLSSLPGSPVCP